MVIPVPIPAVFHHYHMGAWAYVFRSAVFKCCPLPAQHICSLICCVPLWSCGGVCRPVCTLPTSSASAWWHCHGYLCLLYSRVPGRCVDILVCMLPCCLSTATWWQENVCLHAFCLPAPSPGDMGILICHPAISQCHHVAARECLFASRSCPASPCGSCRQISCHISCHNMSMPICTPAVSKRCHMAVQPGLLTSLPCPTTCQCGHTYSRAYYVPMMPLGGTGIPDCMPSVFTQCCMVEGAHLFAHLYDTAPPHGSIGMHVCLLPVSQSFQAAAWHACSCTCHVLVPPRGVQYTCWYT